MAHLMVGISGIRGIYGDGLTDEIAEKFAYAFGKTYGGSIVVGRDSRKSGRPLLQAVISGLHKVGTDVVNIGLASTPTTEMAVVKKNASGGIIITASHNPAEWNGLKMLGPDGVFLDASEGEKILDFYESTGNIRKIIPSGSLAEWDGADEHHIASILSLDIIDSQLISSKKYKVCLDTVNGAGGSICANILERLGCEVHAINSEPTGDFPHGAEPVPENIHDLCALVKERGADIGFAVDPDVDRLSIVNERGEALGEEYTLALAVDLLMEKGENTTACNLSTSRMIDDVAARYGGKVYRSPVGEINVVQQMREALAGIGGEGNGGVIYASLHYGRDAVLGIALILQLITERNLKISDIADSIPQYRAIKEKMEITEKGSWIEPVKRAFAGEEMDLRDGIKIIFSDSWIHIRESNTEPIVRIYSEAPSTEDAKELVRIVYRAIS